MPKALLNRPVLDDRLTFFYGVFSELNEDRDHSASGAPLPLKLKDFSEYCRFWDIPPDDARWMWGVIHIFDKAWLDLQAKKLKADSQNPTKTGA